MAYELDFSSILGFIHPVFHVLMLNKYVGDLSSVIPIKSIGILDILSYEEVLVEIFYRKFHRLRTKDMAVVKAFWRNQKVEEDTYEAEEDIKSKYQFFIPGLDDRA